MIGCGLNPARQPPDPTYDGYPVFIKTLNDKENWDQMDADAKDLCEEAWQQIRWQHGIADPDFTTVCQAAASTNDY